MKAKLNCLALVSDAYGGHGGIAQYNRDLLSAFVESGRVEPVVVIPRKSPERVTPDRGVLQSPPKGRVGYVCASLAAALTRPVDLVFCGHAHLAPLAGVVARARRAKLVTQAHGIEVWSGAQRRMWRSVVQRSDVVLCVSRHTRRTVLEQVAIPPERAIVLSNTVADCFTPGDGSAFRQRYGLVDRRILLTVGRLEPRERYKGQDKVIVAIPELLARGHNVAYVIAGGGDDCVRLKSLAEQRGVQDRVIFLGAVSKEQLVHVYRAADLFVMPSTGEGFGISFLEAMACGTPALGLAAAGASDALGDGSLGAVAQQQDLTKAIESLLDGDNRDPQALAAAVRVRFGRDVFRRGVADVLDRLQ